MADNEKKVNDGAQEVEVKEEATEKKEETAVAEEPKAKVKERSEVKKDGFFKKLGKKIGAHKKDIRNVVLGVLAGTGGTIGVMKLGEWYADKKAAKAAPNVVMEDDDEILSPNVMD